MTCRFVAASFCLASRFTVAVGVFRRGGSQELAPATERDRGGVPSSGSPEPEEDSERGFFVCLDAFPAWRDYCLRFLELRFCVVADLQNNGRLGPLAWWCLSSFTAEKLDLKRSLGDNHGMRSNHKKSESDAGNTAETVRRRIEASGERVWRLADFDGMPFMAVAQALSRLARRGVIQRLGKGLYYRPRQTAFGPSKPNSAEVRSLPIRRRGVFPAGIAAANLLGFTTQNAARVEVATDGLSLPRLLVGKETVIHTRRPESWRGLSETDAALLDFLRNRGEASELSSEDTVDRLLDHFREPGRFERLFKVAASEPPRVRAMLGAIGQQLGQPENRLSALRKSLNPLSRFDFGSLAALKHARQWQAKERKT
jgi:hypothetical protein